MTAWPVRATRSSHAQGDHSGYDGHRGGDDDDTVRAQRIAHTRHQPEQAEQPESDGCGPRSRQRQAAEPGAEQERDHHDGDHQHGLVRRAEGLDGEANGAARRSIDDLVADATDERLAMAADTLASSPTLRATAAEAAPARPARVHGVAGEGLTVDVTPMVGVRFVSGGHSTFRLDASDRKGGAVFTAERSRPGRGSEREAARSGQRSWPMALAAGPIGLDEYGRARPRGGDASRPAPWRSVESVLLAGALLGLVLGGVLHLVALGTAGDRGRQPRSRVPWHAVGG